jgi:hypothetical protein
MTNKTNAKILLRCAVVVMLLSLCNPLTMAIQSAQKEREDETRGLWNKQFMAARARKTAAKTTAKARPGVDGELIGVTFWRLRPATASDDQRILLQQQLLPERVGADTTFSRSDRVRLGIEVPRQGKSYLYIIDREVYPDGSVSDPHLIFPLKSTRGGNNVVTAGKIIEIPARGDKSPYFDLSLPTLREDRVGERLTIIVSPKRLNLPLSNKPLKLDPAQVAQWESQWGGPTERREARGGAGKGWTVEEKGAGEGKRILRQDDPLPQTIYLVKVKPSGPVAVTVPLRIAP